MQHVDSLELIDRATSFAESALTIAGRPTSGNARVRMSDAEHLLTLEITHRDDSTFDVVFHDGSAMQALDDLRQWSTHAGCTFVAERGPRDELRINIVLN
jgi:hypothetical protein